MADIFFYTDVDVLTQQPQTANQAYGPVSGNESTKFRITDIHSATASVIRAIAICDGIVAIQKNNDDPANLVNLILKPTRTFFELSGVNQVPVKYIIYKGILKSSLITLEGADEVIKNPSNELTHHLYEIQNKINREKEKISNPPATPNSIIDKASAKLLKYDISLTSTDSIDQLFYNGNSIYQVPDVKGGWYIGDFDPTEFGLEILLDDIRATSIYNKIKNTETIIEVLPPTGSTQEEIFRKKTDKEEVLFYIDPCAFYGSFHRIFALKYVLSTTTIIPSTATTFSTITSPQDLFDTILSKFHNQNKVYIDIRNDFNRSFNYMENYSNTIKLKIGSENSFNTIDYYNDATYNQFWPILIIKSSSEYLPVTNTENFNSIELQLPYTKTENSKPILFISQGYTDRRFPKELIGRKKFIAKKGSTGFLKPLSLGVLNISGTNTTPASCYIKIKYLKSVENQTSSGIVHRKESFFDNMFHPLLMKTPINLPLPSKTFVSIYNEQDYVTTDIHEKFSASTGIAKDAHNITFFAFAQDLNKRSSSFIPVSLLSEASNKEHFMSHVNDKYVTQKLLEGAVDGTNKYLRFEDTDRLFSRSFRNTDPKLDKHFLSIVLKNNTYDSLLINNGNILDEYDAYIALKNRDDSHTDPVSFQKYTTYNLVLRGYKNVGGSLSLEEFPAVGATQIVLYGYSDENTLILVEAGATTDLYTVDNVDVPCNSTSLSIDDLKLLRAFIKDLSDNSGSFKPNLDLKNNLFNTTNGFYVTLDTDTPATTLINPTFIPTNGFLAEGSFVYAMYKTLKKFNSIKTNLLLDGVTAYYSTNDPLYQKFKNSLVKNGFKEPESETEHLKYKNLLRDDLSIGFSLMGRGQWTFKLVEGVGNNLKNEIYNLMALGNWVESETKFFTFPESVITAEDDIILISLAKILNDITQTFYLEVKKEALCFFNILKNKLSLNIKDPEIIFMSTGEGTRSLGLLNIQDNGLYLFSYIYDEYGNTQFKYKRDNFKQRDKNIHTTIHLSVYGLDLVPKDILDPENDEFNFINPSINVGIKFASKTYVCKLTSDAVPINKDKLYGIDSDTLIVQLIGGGTIGIDATTKVNFIDVTNGKTIAQFDPILNDLTIVKNDEDFELSVELISAERRKIVNFPEPIGTIDYQDHDETQLMVCIVDGQLSTSEIFNLDLDDIYNNNRFELTKVQKTDLFFQDGVFEGVTGLINKLLEPGIAMSNINILLKGGNIGKRKPQEEQAYSTSDVERNLQFDFSLPKLTGRAAERPGELAGDELVRYSHGFVFIEETEVTIVMESYVSPRWARLDEALYGDPTNTTVNKAALIADLDLYTLYGADQAGNITLPTGIDPSVFAPKYDGSGPTAIPSYNPVLSALRCFGLLDGLRSLVRKRATDMGKTVAEINTITQKLDDAIDLTSIPQDLNIGIAKPISKLEFDKFKWYTNTTDKAQFGDLIP